MQDKVWALQREGLMAVSCLAMSCSSLRLAIEQPLDRLRPEPARPAIAGCASIRDWWSSSSETGGGREADNQEQEQEQDKAMETQWKTSKSHIVGNDVLTSWGWGPNQTSNNLQMHNSASHAWKKWP